MRRAQTKSPDSAENAQNKENEAKNAGESSSMRASSPWNQSPDPQAAADAGPTRPTSPGNGVPKPIALQSNEQWLMRVNRQGLPICRDLHGLFTTVVISLSDRWPDWRFPLAFVLPAAIQRMQALQFVQIVRDSANNMQNMLSLSQTKTSFTMNSDTASHICQAFIRAGLLERMAGQEDEVYTPSPKGVHLIDRFVIRHGIATRSVSNLLNVHPICDKLLFMERDEQDDVLLSDAVVRIVFHRMVGSSPRRSEPSAMGMALTTSYAKDSAGQMYETASFSSVDALQWLVQYTTLVSVDEAIVLAAHMVRLGWIEAEALMEPALSNNVATVRVDESLRADHAACEGTFIEGEVYHLTELGVTIAWKVDWVEQPASMPADERPPTSFFFGDRSNEMRSVSPRLEGFEVYGSYMHASPTEAEPRDTAKAATSATAPSATSVPSPAPGPNLDSGSVPSRSPIPEPQRIASPPLDPVVRIPITEVLRRAHVRRSFYAYLKSMRGDEVPQHEAAPVRFWCGVEWFRSDCRLATSGTLADLPDVDVVDVLPSDMDRSQHTTPGTDGMPGPKMRATQQPVLSRSAQLRMGNLLESHALDEHISSATRDSLASALDAYVKMPSPTAEQDRDGGSSVSSHDATRKVEKVLANLLVQCAAAQKEIMKRLSQSTLSQYYDAMDNGDWDRL